jgi:hypothetical protein
MAPAKQHSSPSTIEFSLAQRATHEIRANELVGAWRAFVAIRHERRSEVALNGDPCDSLIDVTMRSADALVIYLRAS